MSQNLFVNALDLSVFTETGAGGVINPALFGSDGHHLLVAADFIDGPLHAKPEVLAMAAFRLTAFCIARQLTINTNPFNHHHTVEQGGKKRGLVRVDYETSLIEIGGLTTVSIRTQVTVRGDMVCEGRLTFLPEHIVQGYRNDLQAIRVSSVRELESEGAERRRWSTSHAIKSVESYIEGGGKPVATKISPRVLDTKTCFTHWNNLSSALGVGASIQKGPHLENTLGGFSFVTAKNTSFSF